MVNILQNAQRRGVKSLTTVDQLTKRKSDKVTSKAG